MVLVAAAFTAGPAAVIQLKLALHSCSQLSLFLYLLVAILPINKIIGRIYPIFGAVLLITAGAF